MAREVERKFLLLDDSWREQVASSEPMHQGYLCGNSDASIRVRIGGEQATLNVKSATIGVERQEFEYEIPLADAEVMLHELARVRVEKTRHLVNWRGFLWEIDEFTGANAGLIVAEIELPDPETPFPKPDWLGLEVSSDPRYYNTELARNPYSQW